MLPALVVLALLVIGPMIIIAVKSVVVFTEDGWSIGLDHYILFWSEPHYYRQFARAAANCLTLAAIVIPLQTVSSLVIVGLVTSRHLKLPKLYIGLAALPNFIGIALLSGTVYYVFNTSGVLRKIAQGLGYPDWNNTFFYDPSTALLAMGLLISFAFFSHALLPMFNVVTQIPRQGLDAGYLARLNGLRRFWEIKSIYLVPVSIISAFFILSSSISSFDVPYALYATSGGPSLNMSADVLSTHILRLFYNFDDDPNALTLIHVMITLVNIGMLTAMGVALMAIPRSLQDRMVSWM